MRIDSYAGTHGDSETFNSPFAGLSMITASESHADEELPAADESPFEAFYSTESPFSGETYTEADAQSEAAQDFLEAVHDEEFEAALEQLLNEGAARALSDAQQWSAAPSEAETRASLDEWIAPLVTGWERAIDGFAGGLENADLHGIAEQELDELLDSLETSALPTEAFDNFLGKLVRKAKAFIKQKLQQAVQFVKNPIKGVVDLAKGGLKAIGSGLSTIGKHLIGPLLAKLKNVGLKLLKGVVKVLVKPLTRILPSSVRPLVPLLTRALGIGEAADEADEATDGGSGTAAAAAEAFDNELLTLFLAAEVDEDGNDELDEADFEEPEHDLVAELDDARARLADQLSTYSGSGAPVAEIEQFIPVVLAVRPLLKLGLKLTGARGKLINLIASPLAKLISRMLGAKAMETIARVVRQDPATMMARAVVDVGFTALGLETADDNHRQNIGGEALASAVEATVMRVLDELPEEALTDPLQVSAAVQRAFAESAAAYLPDRLLRADLPERETAEEGGFWVMMPRSTRPRYRFRKYTKVYAISIPRQVARAVRWSDGGTLESYLLDRGVQTWPVQAEVDLYETLAGTVPGHFTRDETLPANEHASADEFQPLTTEVSGILLREPALGRGRRSLPAAAGSYRPLPGRRFFRVRVGNLPTRRARRPSRLVTVRWDPTSKRMRIAIRLSERRARSLQARMQRAAPAGQRDLPAVLSALREVMVPRLQYRIAMRLIRSSIVKDPTAATRLAGTIAAATTTGLSTYLAQRGAQFATAVADPADGVTIVVSFDGVTSNGSQIPAPQVVATPGIA